MRRLTVVEYYSDFQCPFCLRVMPTLKELRAKYGDKMRLVMEGFPADADFIPQAFGAAQAGNCARASRANSGSITNQLFANQAALQPEFLKKYAAAVGLDGREVQRVSRQREIRGARCRARSRIGTKLGINSTPMVYVNGPDGERSAADRSLHADHRRRARPRKRNSARIISGGSTVHPRIEPTRLAYPRDEQRHAAETPGRLTGRSRVLARPSRIENRAHSRPAGRAASVR